MSTLSELFATDPLQLTKENIDEIIAYMRDARARYALGDKSAGNTKKVAKTAAPKTKSANPIDISDLDL